MFAPFCYVGVSFKSSIKDYYIGFDMEWCLNEKVFLSLDCGGFYFPGEKSLVLLFRLIKCFNE